MNNLIIAEQLHMLAKLMELHQENPFKVKAIANASSAIEKLHQDITLQNYSELSSIKGIGKNILEKIHEVLLYKKIKELEYYENITPQTVIELLNIKGLGPSKVYLLWKEHRIENIEQLIAAAERNQLSSIKGFTSKSQQSILENARFYLNNKNKYPLGIALSFADEIIDFLQKQHIDSEITGELRRQCEIIHQIELITTQKISEDIIKNIHSFSEIPVIIHHTSEHLYYYNLFQTTGSNEFLDEVGFNSISKHAFKNEHEIFDHLKLPYIPAPQRESHEEYFLSKHNKYYSDNIIQYNDFRGILHCHSTYSDGLHSLKEMADYCKNKGFQYFGICDHSQTAKYAGGLSPKKVLEQFHEIENYNQQQDKFRILKGIESDILKNGNLDYEKELLSQFDFIVASIHQHFEMSENEATQRIIKAIENPYTNIIGHLTGRLLSIRKGYPVNHQKIIDACAANKVAVELNANTYRLDIDWRWLRYCVEKGVYIAINPDAHSTTAIDDIRYGIMVAQKAGIQKEQIINTWPLQKIQSFFRKK